jgi:hypothetical protein
MGQYYRGVFLKENKTTVKAFLESWSYGQGAKLMEHSWIKNDFVGAFESLLIEKPQRVVWAGDYADHCKRRKSNLYDRCKESLEIKPTAQVITRKEYPFLVNHSKKEYIDKRHCKTVDGWIIHPLPLMTAQPETVGRGGGDFRIDTDENQGNTDLIGTWCKDLISLEKTVPKGYTYIKFDLVE